MKKPITSTMIIFGLVVLFGMAGVMLSSSSYSFVSGEEEEPCQGATIKNVAGVSDCYEVDTCQPFMYDEARDRAQETAEELAKIDCENCCEDEEDCPGITGVTLLDSTNTDRVCLDCEEERDEKKMRGTWSFEYSCDKK